MDNYSVWTSRAITLIRRHAVTKLLMNLLNDHQMLSLRYFFKYFDYINFSFIKALNLYFFLPKKNYKKSQRSHYLWGLTQRYLPIAFSNTKCLPSNQSMRLCFPKITIKMYNHAFNFQSIFFYDSTRLKRTQMCTRKCSAALIWGS